MHSAYYNCVCIVVISENEPRLEFTCECEPSVQMFNSLMDFSTS